MRKTRKSLNRALASAKLKLRRAERLEQQEQQSKTRRHSPKQYWERLRLCGTDPGAPRASKALILDHQTDEKGRLITSKVSKCKANMRQNRQDLYNVPQSLTAECRQGIEEAIALVHLDNLAPFTTSAMDPSFAAQCAADPFPDSVRRLYGLEACNSDEAVGRANVLSANYHFEASILEAAAEFLQQDVTLDEVLSACKLMKDVGPGTDGLPPAMLTSLDQSNAASWISSLFNRCLALGTLPSEWQVHRVMFLYKGKNTDPFHLGNYRGIAVDNLLLKLWSTVLNARLERYLEATNGLSAMQGGFRHLRGTPESVLALAETVRASIVGNGAGTGRDVELVFVDIKVAYDSVLHPLLWKCCLDKGVKGRFLASLQAIYRQASARVHTAGELLDGVPLLRGVLQGNPLSPVLFNMYIDGAIGELSAMRRPDGRPYGLLLPRVGNPHQHGLQTAASDDFLQCLFFADDGTLVETDHAALQTMLDHLSSCFSALGLEINVKKTKWMIVPRLLHDNLPGNPREREYLSLKARALGCPLRVYGLPIELVDQFPYLGFKLRWHWDFDFAWMEAAQRARSAYFDALRSGWQHRSGSLASQLDAAQASILSHFNYVAAVAGALSLSETAPWRECDKVVGWVLQTITGLNKGNVTALKVETGLWDDGMHLHMQVLRFWRKVLTMPTDSPCRRAAQLSLQTYTSALNAPRSPALQALIPAIGREAMERFREPALRFRQCWAQSVYASASRFGLPDVDVGSGDPEALVLIQRTVDFGAEWSPSALDDLEVEDCRYRLLVKPLPAAVVDGFAPVVRFVEGENCWTVPPYYTRYEALHAWTDALKEAIYASIRLRGNSKRHAAVTLFLKQCTKIKGGKPDRLQTWAATISGPAKQAYWFLPDPNLARWILKARFDQCPTEDFFRTRPHHNLPRIEHRYERACYLCTPLELASGDQAARYWPETLAHTLLLCAHPALVRRRQAFVKALRTLARSAESRRVSSLPDDFNFNDLSVQFTILQLCTGVGSNYGASNGLQRVPIPSQPAALRADSDPRRTPQFSRITEAARKAIEWMRPLLQDWLNVEHKPARPEQPQDCPGFKLALLVSRHLRDVFDARRSALASPVVKDSFAARSRDPVAPPPVAAGSVPDAGNAGVALDPSIDRDNVIDPDPALAGDRARASARIPDFSPAQISAAMAAAAAVIAAHSSPLSSFGSAGRSASGRRSRFMFRDDALVPVTVPVDARDRGNNVPHLHSPPRLPVPHRVAASDTAPTVVSGSTLHASAAVVSANAAIT